MGFLLGYMVWPLNKVSKKLNITIIITIYVIFEHTFIICLTSLNLGISSTRHL